MLVHYYITMLIQVPTFQELYQPSFLFWPEHEIFQILIEHSLSKP